MLVVRHSKQTRVTQHIIHSFTLASNTTPSLRKCLATRCRRCRDRHGASIAAHRPAWHQHHAFLLGNSYQLCVYVHIATTDSLQAECAATGKAIGCHQTPPRVRHRSANHRHCVENVRCDNDSQPSLPNPHHLMHKGQQTQCESAKLVRGTIGVVSSGSGAGST